ncbi:MAG: HEAT repeat domain-containing protein, partial [Planctomycetota bacterium]|nr:HEAT repeat domain-containing protein [Planctomycetota bacterium]
VDQGKVRALKEHQGVALMYMDRFAEAERIFQALVATSKDDKERSAYEERLREVAKRRKAVASGEEKPFSKQAFWIEAIGNGSSWVRARALEKVATIQDETVYKSLLAGLRDPVADVRSAAAIALGNRGDPQAAPALQGLLRDPSPEVRDSARLALQELGKEVPPE